MAGWPAKKPPRKRDSFWINCLFDAEHRQHIGVIDKHGGIGKNDGNHVVADAGEQEILTQGAFPGGALQEIVIPAADGDSLRIGEFIAGFLGQGIDDDIGISLFIVGGAADRNSCLLLHI